MPKSQSTFKDGAIKITTGEEPQSTSHTDRIQRVHRVLGYVTALAGEDAFNTLSRIADIEDGNGTLYVNWKGDGPTVREEFWFATAWASHIGDGSENVEHTVAMGAGL